MFVRAIAIGVAVLVAASPGIAQQRGTVEFGAFGNRSFYDSAINVSDGWGGGVRIAAFILPRLSVEGDIGRRDGPRPLGLQSVEVEAFAARLLAVPVMLGPLSLLAGAGIIHTDYQVDVTDGLQALLGAKLALGHNMALRVDGVMDFNDNDSQNTAVQVGMSFYRHPRHPALRTQTITAPPPSREDSVSAAETRRLRAVEAQYLALRASLAQAEPEPEPEPRAPSSVAALATMSEVIHFAHDESVLDAKARSILDAKVPVFRANPDMRIVIIGHTSTPGTDDYNWALGFRRAEAARAYLVSRDIDPIRIEIATGGEHHLVMEGPSDRAAAANRRAEFRILVADPHLTAPH